MTLQQLYGFILLNLSVFKPFILEKKAKASDNNIGTNLKKNIEAQLVPKTIRTEYGGVGIVSKVNPSNLLSEYVKFSIFNSDILSLMQQVMKIFKLDSGGDCENFLCHASDVNSLLKYFSSDIYDVLAPKSTINSIYIESYIKANNNVLSAYTYRSMYCYKELKEHGIWDRNNLYTSVKWTFNDVEKFKGSINWKKLIELSDLKWDYHKLKDYETYIPFATLNSNSYWEHYNKDVVICDFSNVLLEDSSFIFEYFNKIEIISFLETAKYSFKEGDIIKLYNKLHDINECWSQSYPNTPASEQLQCSFFRAIINNANIKWTSELLLELDTECKEFLNLEYNKRTPLIPLFKITFSNQPEFNYKLNGPLFLSIMKEGKQPYDAYSINFTPDKISTYSNDWNNIIDEKYSGIHRLSRDTYYYRYTVSTMWNYFNNNKNIPLTYDICKVLSTLTIIVGGTYEKEYENQEYYDEGFHSKEVNALEFFASHKIKDNYEIDKIYKDESLLSLLIQYNNTDIIEHCLNLFFCDYSIDSFLNVVNNLNQPNNTF